MFCINIYFSELNVYYGKYVFGKLKYYVFNNLKDFFFFVFLLGREGIKYICICI